MSNMKIMNCPCCSSSAHLETMKVRKGWEANICCNDCGLNIHTITFDTEEEAINNAVEKWNKRKPMERIVDRLEGLRAKPTETVYDTILVGSVIEIVKEEGGVE